MAAGNITTHTAEMADPTHSFITHLITSQRDQIISLLSEKYGFDPEEAKRHCSIEIHSEEQKLVSNETKFLEAYEKFAKMSYELGYGDPFSYARGKEAYMAIYFGHSITDTYAGSDGKDEHGEYEYKSTTQTTIRGTYTGISCHQTWEEQFEYLRTKKIGLYRHHYYARFNNGRIVEAYKIPGHQVLEILCEKLRKRFDEDGNIKSDQLTHKDPRLSATITQKEIYKYGTKVEKIT